MAVCNLFNDLNNASGNFMLFSQYVEDITHNYAEGDNYKVIPSKFVALDIDYTKLKKYDSDLNHAIPTFFQNCFENACAYERSNYSNYYSNTLFLDENPNWSSEISRNLFWNLLYQENLISDAEYVEYNTDHHYFDEIVYYGNISMHSFNEHKGMGYNELYCYIPTDASYVRCAYSKLIDESSYDNSNNNAHLEGRDLLIGEYPQKYYCGADFLLSFEDDTIENLPSRNLSNYNINTIVVLYDVLEKQGDSWVAKHNSIPMGIYIAGRFENDELTNIITKHTASSYSSGTAYGLRICTRFIATSEQGILVDNEIIADDTNYANISQLMTGMNENLSRMRDISKMSYDAQQQHAELLSVFKNSKTNVPYIKKVNGYDCWFINGKFVANVAAHKYASDTDVLNLFK